MSRTASNDNSVDFKRNLIALIKQNPVVFNSNLHDYSDRAIKERVWEEIAQKLNTTSVIAKSRWSILRSCFRREIRHQNKKIRGGTFKSRPWNYMKDMEFITPFLQHCDEIVPSSKDILINNSHSSDEDEAVSISNLDTEAKVDAKEKLIQIVNRLSKDIKEPKTNYTQLIEDRVDRSEDNPSCFKILSNNTVEDDTVSISNSDTETKVDIKEKIIQIVNGSSKDVKEPKNNYTQLTEDIVDRSENHDNCSTILSNNSYQPDKGIIPTYDDSLTQFFASILATVKTFPTEWQIKAKLAVFQQVTELEMQINQQKNK